MQTWEKYKWDEFTYIQQQASRHPLGEKAREPRKESDRGPGGLRTDILSRVLESCTSIIFLIPTAINWPHGDQTAHSTHFEALTLAVHESHEAGIPVMTLYIGEQMCWPYSFQIIVEWGVRKSAEWQIWGTDWLITSKNSVTNRRQSVAVSSRVLMLKDPWI